MSNVILGSIWITILFASGLAYSSSVDYPGADWIPAPRSNYSRGRPVPVTEIVIHTIEDGHYSPKKFPGKLKNAINTFRNPRTEVSSHYLIGKDGRVVQMVREKDRAHHIRGRKLKTFTIGIEHEGHAAMPYVTEAMLKASARLVRDIAKRQKIPRDRDHIRGHSAYPRPRGSVPKVMYDPEGPNGNHWPWEKYMRYVKDDKPPSLEVGNPSRKLLSNGSVTRSTTISIKAGDGPTGSGIDRLEVRQGNSEDVRIFFSDETDYEGSHTYSLSNLPKGTIHVRISDRMGNSSTLNFRRK